MTSPAPAETLPKPAETPAETPTKPEEKTPTITFTPEQEEAIRQRISAARKDGEKDGRTKAEKDTSDKAESDRVKREQDEAVKRGEFDAVRTDLEGKLTAAATERDDIKKRYDDAVAQIKPGVDAKWATLPAEVTKLYRGAEDDVIAKSAFIADTDDLVRGLTARSATGPSGPAWPNTPRPNGGTNPDDEKEARRGVADLVRSRL